MDSLLGLLRCPCCMSPLTLSPSLPLPQEERRVGGEGILRCTGCARDYTLRREGAGLIVPSLRRGDALATLDQDIIASHSDPDSARLDYRRHIARAEQRELFLAALTGYRSGRATQWEPPALPIDNGTASRRRTPAAHRGIRGYAAGEAIMQDRFVRALPPRATVLDAGSADRERSVQLAGAGRRIVRIEADVSEQAMEIEMGGGSDEPVLIVGADVMEMPFAAATIDGVRHGLFGTIRPDRRTVFFRQVNRVLRPGGLLYLVAPAAPSRDTLPHYLLWRYLRRQPVVRDERVAPPPRGRTGGWRYHATATARDLHVLCREHGFKVLALRQPTSCILLLARKERGTGG